MAKQTNPFASAFPGFQMPDFGQMPNFQMPDFQKFAAMNGGGFESFMQSSNAMMKAVGELNAEILGFTKERLDAGIAASQSLAKCTTVQAALDVQMDFARSETEVYLNEAKKIMELASNAANEGMKPLKQAAAAATNGHNGHNGHGTHHARTGKR
ncbi:MAG: phasin family protein [Rhodospirillales bacterium]|nr:phasin family protein [Rhodospirillales bacterium]